MIPMLIPAVGQRVEHVRRDARMSAHAGADERDLRDVRVVREPARLDLVPRAARGIGSARRISVLGSVNEMSVCPSAETFWTIMSTFMPTSASVRKTRAAIPGRSGTPRIVTSASDGVVRDPEMIGLLHQLLLTDDPGALAPRERGADVDRHSVVACELDRAQHQHLRARRGQLEHLLVGDGVELARFGHDPRVGREDALDVGVDLADIGVERGRERDRRRVRAAAAERRHLERRSRRPGSRRRARSRPARAPRGCASGGSRAPSRRRVLGVGDDAGLRAGERDRASWPRSWIAIAASAHEIRSPTESSMSSSRGCGPARPGGRGRSARRSSRPSPRGRRRRRCRRVARRNEPARDRLNRSGPGDGGAAELLDDETHGETLPASTLGPRRGARAVERGGLENRWACKRPVGSNPTPRRFHCATCVGSGRCGRHRRIAPLACAAAHSSA